MCNDAFIRNPNFSKLKQNIKYNHKQQNLNHQPVNKQNEYDQMHYHSCHVHFVICNRIPINQSQCSIPNNFFQWQRKSSRTSSTWPYQQIKNWSSVPLDYSKLWVPILCSFSGFHKRCPKTVKGYWKKTRGSYLWITLAASMLVIDAAGDLCWCEPITDSLSCHHHEVTNITVADNWISKLDQPIFYSNAKTDWILRT